MSHNHSMFNHDILHLASINIARAGSVWVCMIQNEHYLDFVLFNQVMKTSVTRFSEVVFRIIVGFN